MALDRRRRRSYQERRRYWERAHAAGWIDAAGLQRAYASVHGMTAHAAGRGWRAKNLSRFPPVEC